MRQHGIEWGMGRSKATFESGPRSRQFPAHAELGDPIDCLGRAIAEAEEVGASAVNIPNSVARALITRLSGICGASCALQDEGLPCACGMQDLNCPNREQPARQEGA